MKVFCDTSGTEWKISVNVLTIKRVLEETGLRLTDIFSSEQKISQFFSDDVKFCEVLWAIVKPQADAAGKDAEQFFAAIDGTVIEQALGALLEKVADFFQEPRRSLLRRVLAKFRAAQQKLTTEGVLAVEKTLETADFETFLLQNHTNSASSSQDSAA